MRLTNFDGPTTMDRKKRDAIKKAEPRIRKKAIDLRTREDGGGRAEDILMALIETGREYGLIEGAVERIQEAGIEVTYYDPEHKESK